jgi:hypothetical protein
MHSIEPTSRLLRHGVSVLVVGVALGTLRTAKWRAATRLEVEKNHERLRERVSLLGGRFEIRSEPGAGTTIEAEVELPETRENPNNE